MSLDEQGELEVSPVPIEGDVAAMPLLNGPTATLARPAADLKLEVKSTSRRLLPTAMYTRTRPIRTTEITENMVNVFLDELEKTGMFKTAAARAGLTSYAVKQLRKMDDEFEAMCQDAREQYIDNMEAEGFRRGVEGWDEDVFGKEGKIGTVHKYDSNIFLAYIKRYRPEFSEKHISEVKVSGGIVVVPMTAANPAEWAEQFNVAAPVDEPKRLE